MWAVLYRQVDNFIGNLKHFSLIGWTPTNETSWLANPTGETLWLAKFYERPIPIG